MSLNESIVEEATLLLSRKLGASRVLSDEPFDHRVSGFNPLHSDCGPSWGRTMRNSPERSSVL